MSLLDVPISVVWGHVQGPGRVVDVHAGWSLALSGSDSFAVKRISPPRAVHRVVRFALRKQATSRVSIPGVALQSSGQCRVALVRRPNA